MGCSPDSDLGLQQTSTNHLIASISPLTVDLSNLGRLRIHCWQLRPSFLRNIQQFTVAPCCTFYWFLGRYSKWQVAVWLWATWAQIGTGEVCTDLPGPLAVAKSRMQLVRLFWNRDWLVCGFSWIISPKSLHFSGGWFGLKLFLLWNSNVWTIGSMCQTVSVYHNPRGHGIRAGVQSSEMGRFKRWS